MATAAQLRGRKVLTPHSRSRSRSGEVPTPPSSSQTFGSSLTPQSSSVSELSSSQTSRDREPTTLSSADQPVHRSFLEPDATQQFTFRHLHNVTPEPSPQPARTHSTSSESLLFGFGSPSLLVPSSTNRSNPQAIFRTSTEDKILNSGPVELETTSISPTVRPENASLRRDSSVSMQLVSPSGMVEPLEPDLGMSLRTMRLSDVSIATEEEIEAVPYSVRDELAPEEPFFSAVFQDSLQKSFKVAKETAIAIDACVQSLGTDDTLKRLRADATALSSFQGSDTRTIAILGDSGEGKSSLINSLLHFPEIAKTGDIGSACTSVVTEYRQRKPGQTAEILLEVEYLSKLQIEDLIKELVWDFRKFYLPHVESQDTSAQDYIQWERESEQAWSALESAFKHNRQFKKQFLKDTTDGASERIIEQLMTWADELQWPEGGRDGVWSSSAETADECCTKTSIFMNDRFWPFTKVIRVYLNAQVLKTGVVLADLPGLHDTNVARVRTTQAYLMKCDLFLIVANIARAITNQSLKSSLHTVLSRHMPMEWEDMSGPRNLNFAFVCTMAERFNIETEKRDFCGPGKPISASKMLQLDKDIEQAKRRGDSALKKTLKRRQEVMLMDARNQHVKRGLQEAYSTNVPNGQLEVFCVSNDWYRKFTKKGNTAMVDASGIPEVRRFCHSVTAKAQLLEAQNFMQARLQGLLTSVDLWATGAQALVNKPQAPPVELIHDEIKTVKKRILNKIKDVKESFLETLNEMLSDYFNKRDQFWEADARKRHNGWTDWHWTQYNAWCIRNGSHSTPKRPFVDWNAEIIWKMRSELAFPWQILEEEVPTSFDGILESTEVNFQTLKTFTRSQGLSALIEESIDLQIQDCRYQIALVQRSFTKEIARVRRYAFEPCGNSFILAEMLPAYRAASDEYGPGKAARQRSHVKRKIEGGALFPNIAFKIRSSIEPLVENTFLSIKHLIQHSFDSVKDDISTSLPSAQPQLLLAGKKEVEAMKRLAAAVEALRDRHMVTLEEIRDI